MNRLLQKSIVCNVHVAVKVILPGLKRRISNEFPSYFSLKESVFIEKYLKLDEDGDYVAVSKPCPFLGADNKCSIYEDRPSDCRRFPYTDEDVILKRPQLTQKNSSFCPIVVSVLKVLLEENLLNIFDLLLHKLPADPVQFHRPAIP